MASGFSTVIIPWDRLTLRDAVFDQRHLDAIAAIGTPMSDFFSQIVAATLDFDRSVGIDGSTHPDSLTAAVLLHPELITASSRYHVDVEAASQLTRGYSAMSWGVHGLEPNATVIEAVDSDGFFGYIKDLVGQRTEPSRPVLSADSA